MKVFDGDSRALTAARTKINEEFKKNKRVTDRDSILAVSFSIFLLLIRLEFSSKQLFLTYLFLIS